MKKHKRAPRAPAKPAIQGFMFDLDGTLVLGDRTGKSYDVLPGAVDVLNRLSERGIPWVVLTNGSAYPASVQAPRLRAAGLPVPDERLLTPSSVTAGVLARRGVKRALILGSPGVAWTSMETSTQLFVPGHVPNLTASRTS